ncbi:hypothetical protein ACFWVC_13150 [Streptomyces sp. NPDC058691]|uniref:hypothetical protein n=1 Tax=Streptomyces sp. NPDC058691 TaxID=3346601 RepID=UPI003665BD3C
MSNRAKYVIGGLAVGLVAFWVLAAFLPNWIALLIVLGVPAAAYLTLDPSQRRRLRRAGRKQIGR